MTHFTLYNALRSLAAGILIAIACMACLAAGGGALGAVMFSVGLVAVILLDAELYTGRVGYAKWQDALPMLAMWVYNTAGAYICGTLYRLAYGPVSLDRMVSPLWVEALQAALCGALIYCAVEGWRHSKQVLAIILPVAAFVLMGAEHCIADAFYLAAGCASGSLPYGLLWMLVVALGNAVGAVGLRWLCRDDSYDFSIDNAIIGPADTTKPSIRRINDMVVMIAKRPDGSYQCEAYGSGRRECYIAPDTDAMLAWIRGINFSTVGDD